jgi:mannan endo-1,6-alpha-mannosidase
MQEVACEPLNTCDRNMICYKGFLATWLAFTALVAPYTYPDILPKLQYSGQAAGKACTGGSDGTQCGITWVTGKFDGNTGLEEEMAVLGAFSANMIAFQPAPPLTSSTGGNSQGDPNAGLGDSSSDTTTSMTITTADRAGAGVVTALFMSGWLGMVAWLVFGR